TGPHCARFAEVLNEVTQKYGDRVQVLAVVNPPDNMNTVGQYIAGHKIAYPVMFDSGQAAYSYVRKPSFDLPLVYVIDANGMIQAEYGYSPMASDVFDGRGLFPVID